MVKNDVCITGMGIVSALGVGVKTHLDALVNGLYRTCAASIL